MTLTKVVTAKYVGHHSRGANNIFMLNANRRRMRQYYAINNQRGLEANMTAKLTPLRKQLPVLKNTFVASTNTLAPGAVRGE